MNIERFKNLEQDVTTKVMNMCEDHPELVEDLYDDRVELNTELEDLKMRRSLAKRLVG